MEKEFDFVYKLIGGKSIKFKTIKAIDLKTAYNHFWNFAKKGTQIVDCYEVLRSENMRIPALISELTVVDGKAI